MTATGLRWTEGLPAAEYVSGEILEAEQSAIFGRSWMALAPLEELAEPGAVALADLGDTPVVLVVGDDARLRGFVNACRHRGHPVVTTEERHRVLRCPYHAWTYRLSGTLRSVPRCAVSADDAQELALVPIAVATWRGIVFGNVDVDGASFEEAHPNLDDLAKARDVTLEGFSYLSRKTVQIAANWKSWLENVHECFHCSSIHRESFADAWDVAPSRYEFLCDGSLIGQFAPPSGSPRTFGGATRPLGQIFVWPATFVSVDHCVAFVGVVRPVSPTATEMTTFTFVNRSLPSREIARWLSMYDATVHEDIAAVEAQQRALRGRGFERTLVLPEREPGIVHFHSLLREAMEQVAS